MDENNKPDQVTEGETPGKEPILDLVEEVGDESEAAEESIPSDDTDADDPFAETVDLDEGFDDDFGIGDDDDDFVGSMGMEIGDEEDEDIYGSDGFEDVAPVEGVDVSDDQLDAALERVVKRMFYDKIDRVLVEVIEKTVTSEIERLKRLLLEDASGDEQ